MTFATLESSRHEGAPVALMLFRFGENAADVYAYTSAEDPINFDSVTYVPAPIYNGAITSSGSMDRSMLEIRLPKSLDICKLFHTFPPSRLVTLRIFGGHAGDTEFQAVWSGRLITQKIEVDECIFMGEPVSSAFRRSGLRRTYSYGCPHVLYGKQCRAAEVAFSVTATVVGVDSPYVSFNPGWNAGFDAEKFTFGRAQWTNALGRTEYRSIVRLQSDNQLLFSGDFDTIQVGQSIALSLGCDHKLDGDCTTIFDNAANFGGQPWIPLKNPVGAYNIFLGV